jgi:hypothetical protein
MNKNIRLKKNDISPHSHYPSLNLILQTPMLQALFIFWKYSCGQMSFWADVLLDKCLLGKCLSGQMSFWENVLLGERLLGKCIFGLMSFWANVFWANVFWANVLWANVHMVKCLCGQMSLGKCLWANASGQMSLGKFCMGKCRVTNQTKGFFETNLRMQFFVLGLLNTRAGQLKYKLNPARYMLRPKY